MKNIHLLTLVLSLSILTACTTAGKPEKQPSETLVQVTQDEVFATKTPAKTEEQEAPFANEINIISIPLPENLTAGRAEISGLAWYGDKLVLLPQYPNRFKNGGVGSLFYIEKTDLLDFIMNPGDEPINVVPIAFDDGGVSNQVSGFEGFEAIVFNGNTFYISVESRTGNGMMGYIYRGAIDDGTSRMEIESDIFQQVTPQADFTNASEEAMLIYEDQVYSFYEDYGRDKNLEPIVHIFDLNLLNVETASMTHLEYRLTDVTEVDGQGRFWGINYFFPGDVHLLTEVDPIAEKYGEGLTHSQFAPVERLVQFQITSDGIVLIDEPPLQLSLLEDNEARNWEGIVSIDNLGFIVVTDKFPFTILGFCDFLR